MIRQNRIGLFFGSFNPIHSGHMMLANYMLAFTDLHEVWFVVSPQNPLKEKKTLLADYHRLDLVYKAVDDYPGFSVVDIEFRMPKPSYTIDTLVRLQERYPGSVFSVIVGADSLQSLHKWKNHTQLLEQFRLLVYPRKGFDAGTYAGHPHIEVINAPEIEVSSSFIRRAIASGKDVRFFLPPKVYDYITEMHFYE
ncbi:MAG: nicotinate-nucleotide adenylyltransferase [Bacteroidetes bacterium]|nr:nicotinate-nucleotide adenylyltransferase [Bacteroidota bacterium]